MVDWVERGKPPQGLTLVEQDAKPPFAVTRARPLCQWPLVPRYKGGAAASASSFTCEP
ncbi:MAG TPA: tannase/feruloyl esterase family alpha/beta hydrolase [Burkholderiaceae bacterium]|nr:tannase/feruloyl esterase family alpha/beta hydrolase [Burkholderiaceae bacterium]